MIESFQGASTIVNPSRGETMTTIQKLLQVHGYETGDLIHQYYIERHQYQLQMTSSPYGLLTIKCAINGDNLEVSEPPNRFIKQFILTFFPLIFRLFRGEQIEIMNARNLLPMDGNSSCDPFVRIYLVPEEKFASTAKFKTAVQNKTCFPLFDEKFVL